MERAAVSLAERVGRIDDDEKAGRLPCRIFGRRGEAKAMCASSDCGGDKLTTAPAYGEGRDDGAAIDGRHERGISAVGRSALVIRVDVVQDGLIGDKPTPTLGPPRGGSGPARRGPVFLAMAGATFIEDGQAEDRGSGGPAPARDYRGGEMRAGVRAFSLIGVKAVPIVGGVSSGDCGRPHRRASVAIDPSDRGDTQVAELRSVP